jgi:hypothetical protein
MPAPVSVLSATGKVTVPSAAPKALPISVQTVARTLAAPVPVPPIAPSSPTDPLSKLCFYWPSPSEFNVGGYVAVSEFYEPVTRLVIANDLVISARTILAANGNQSVLQTYANLATQSFLVTGLGNGLQPSQLCGSIANGSWPDIETGIDNLATALLASIGLGAPGPITSITATQVSTLNGWQSNWFSQAGIAGTERFYDFVAQDGSIATVPGYVWPSWNASMSSLSVGMAPGTARAWNATEWSGYASYLNTQGAKISPLWTGWPGATAYQSAQQNALSHYNAVVSAMNKAAQSQTLEFAIVGAAALIVIPVAVAVIGGALGTAAVGAADAGDAGSDAASIGGVATDVSGSAGPAVGASTAGGVTLSGTAATVGALGGAAGAVAKVLAPQPAKTTGVAPPAVSAPGISVIVNPPSATNGASGTVGAAPGAPGVGSTTGILTTALVAVGAAILLFL